MPLWWPFRFLFSIIVAGALTGQALAQPGAFEIESDQKSTATGARLCIAVDTKIPVNPERGAMLAPKGAAPIPLTGTFYPVVAARCDQADAALPMKWSVSNTRELRVRVADKWMCLSARPAAAFIPLIEPYLRAFDAAKPDSPNHHLVLDFTPGGKLDERRVKSMPPLVASECGRGDALDFWFIDGANGFISTTAGSDGTYSAPRRCVAILGDTHVRPPKFDVGMPIAMAACGDLRAYRHPDRERHTAWTLTSGTDGLPAYVAPERKEYFSGVDGLPIIGSMGRCLTWDKPARNVVTSACDGRVEQQWRREGSAIRFGRNGDCLTEGPDGWAALMPCKGEAAQKWAYVVSDPVPNPKWLNGDLYGRIQPEGRLDQCLIVNIDPFSDPMLQRNRVRIAACSRVLPRQQSWFSTDRVLTIRIGLIRASDNDGSKQSAGRINDDQIKLRMESLAFHLSESYAALGVRFVFDPDRDFLALRSTDVNQARTPSIDAVAEIAGVAFFDRMAVVTIANLLAGGVSSGHLVDYEPERTIRPIERTRIGRPKVKDLAGLPIVAPAVGEIGIDSEIQYTSHHAHEFGHYFGLWHTFQPDPFADTPEDLRITDAWNAMGTETCGNPRTVTVDNKKYTPDRINNEGYFGCLHGRTHTSKTPMQLGYMIWQINNQLNRYPKVACQPTAAYDANHVECENAASLERCRETAEYLKKQGGTDYVCAIGGQYRRAIAQALRYPAVQSLLRKTPPGQSLMKRLGGKEPGAPVLADAAFNGVADKLKDCTNLPLTMAVVTRLRELQAAVQQKNPVLAKSAFDEKGKPLTAGDEKLFAELSRTVFTDSFIQNVPALIK